MSDVSRIKGPGAPQEPGGKKDKSVTDAEKFKEMMKVDKVREVDPEEQKKRKRQEEAEEESKSKEGAVPAPLPPSPIQSAPLDIKGKKLEGAAPTEGAPPSQAPSSATPTQAAPPAAPQEPEGPSLPSGQMPSVSAPSEGQEAKGEKKPAESILPPAAEGAEKASPESPLFQKEIPEEAKEKFFTQFAPTQKEKAEEAAEQSQVEAQEAAAPPPSTPSEEGKKGEKGKEEQISVSAAETTSPPTFPFLQETSPSTSLPPYVNFTTEFYELFDRMVSTMSVMVDTDVKETTIDLSSEKFASSSLYGSQIIIKEFSTAPNQYNIQILGNTQIAVDLFQANADDLVASLNSGKYNFRVNRLEIGERPLFRRKESPSGDTGDLK